MMKNPKNLIIFAVLGGIVGTGFGYGLKAFTGPSWVKAEEAKERFSADYVTRVIYQQQKDWNAGDIDGFMQGYWKSEGLRFSSGGDVTTGWQNTLDRYKARYSDRAKMGVLEFDIHDVIEVAPNFGIVQGGWKLTRTGDTPSGLFTLHMKKIDGEWVIVSDHTISASN